MLDLFHSPMCVYQGIKSWGHLRHSSLQLAFYFKVHFRVKASKFTTGGRMILLPLSKRHLVTSGDIWMTPSLQGPEVLLKGKDMTSLQWTWTQLAALVELWTASHVQTEFSASEWLIRTRTEGICKRTPWTKNDPAQVVRTVRVGKLRLNTWRQLLACYETVDLIYIWINVQVQLAG